MRLRDYVSESSFYDKQGRSKVVTEEFANDFIKKHCSKSKKGFHIYRGHSSYGEDIYYLDPSTSGNRVSPYATHNFYNMLMSNLPSWSAYPKRTKSIICTTSYNDASDRQLGSNPYIVLPMNGSLIGVCSEKDIWFSFPNLDIYNMNNFNAVVEALITPIAIESRKMDFANADQDYKVFVKLCNKMDRNKEKLEMDEVSNTSSNTTPKWITDYAENDEKFINVLNNVMAPNKNDFSLVKSETKGVSDQVEVWTDSPSLLIRMASPFAVSLGLEY